MIEILVIVAYLLVAGVMYLTAPEWFPWWFRILGSLLWLPALIYGVIEGMIND